MSDTIVLLQEKLQSHIDDYEKHREAEDARWNHLIVCQEQNTQSIKELTEATRDIIQVWQAADGTMKTMSALGAFFKWLSGFTMIGIFVAWLSERI